VTAHEHEWIEFARFSHAPINPVDPIQHTGFTVLICVGCPAATTFPVQNFALATDLFRRHIRGLLRAAGHELQ
jgi:hypothetical protein